MCMKFIRGVTQEISVIFPKGQGILPAPLLSDMPVTMAVWRHRDKIGNSCARRGLSWVLSSLLSVCLTPPQCHPASQNRKHTVLSSQEIYVDVFTLESNKAFKFLWY